MKQYPENEYINTQNASMAGKLIRSQGERFRETPAEYVARKYRIRGDACDKRDSTELPEQKG